MAKSSAVVSPNMGLYLGRPHLSLHPKMLQDGHNFRIRLGKLNNLNLGWTRFSDFTLNGPVMHLESIALRSGVEHLLMATLKDVYKYDLNTDSIAFLTPRYVTGTASASGTAVTGVGTTWSTNAKAGDFIHFGSNSQTDPNAVWYEIANVGGNTSITLTSSAGTIANGNYTIRKVFTGDINDLWQTAMFYNAPGNADEWWITNGQDAIMRWNGTNTQLEILSMGFTAKTLAVYANSMIFLNLVQSGEIKPADMINSQPGDPKDVAGAASDQYKVHGFSGEVYKALPIGDLLAIYSKNNVTVAQFVGGDLGYVFRQVVSGTGALGPRAIADFGDYHQFVSVDGLYVFDGATIHEVGAHVWRDVLRSQRPSAVKRAFHVFDDFHGELNWSIPLAVDTGDHATIAYVEHFLEDLTSSNIEPRPPFSRKDFPFTSAGFFTQQSTLRWSDISETWQELNFRWTDQFFQVSFPILLVGDGNGKVFKLNAAQTADGANMASFIKFGRVALYDGNIRGLLARVYPFVGSITSSLSVTAHMLDYAEIDTPNISDTKTLDHSAGDRFVTPYHRGRFMELEFGTTGAAWEMSGYDVEVRPGGRR